MANTTGLHTQRADAQPDAEPVPDGGEMAFGFSLRTGSLIAASIGILASVLYAIAPSVLVSP